ncbi:MAG TPA: protease inhibitor I42 family protein [Anaerolineales bacterium]|nr:protease inhibitor I42 family protein [Anaerolineales bacterium]
MKRISVLWIAAVLLAGCATSSPTPSATLPPTVETPNTLSEPTDHTQLITVKAGETFDLVVPSNPSTGYHWEILPALDENMLELIAQDYIAEEPVLAGSGGVDVWTFRAVDAGDTTIVLGYFAPGSETSPEEEVTFSIHAE